MMIDTITKETNLSQSIVLNGMGSIERALSTAEKIAEQLTDEIFIQRVIPDKNKNSISIEQIRSIKSQLMQKNTEEKARVIIINPASSMTPEAQNALLKSLEEIKNNWYIILPVSALSEILPTIISRSTIVNASAALTKYAVNKSEGLIQDSLYEYKHDTDIDHNDMKNAVSFIKLGIADRLVQFRKTAESREDIYRLLLSLRVLCVSTMRNASTIQAKKQWSNKVVECDDIISMYTSNASGKLLLLGASTRL